VKPWLAARTTLGAFVPDLGADGFPLVGGRLEILDSRPVPTVVYRRREHFISVAELPLASAGGGPAAAEGYHVVRWRDGERAYVAISDLDAGELATFAERFAKAAQNIKPATP
jgi:anti-sigma factor RsiW